MPKLYKVVLDGEVIETHIPGKYAGSRKDKIFGRLDCPAGKRLLKKNRVFFARWKDAVRAGFRPCLVCKPHRIRFGEELCLSHPALNKSHVAVWKTTPCPYPRKPLVCFYVALNWDSPGSHRGERTRNQASLEKWFLKSTAIGKAIAWGKNLGLPVIDRGFAENWVLYVPAGPVSYGQLRARRDVIARKRAISLTCSSYLTQTKEDRPK